MEDLEKSNLRFPFYMLAGLFLAAYLAELKLINWQTLGESSFFALSVFGCFVFGTISTVLNWTDTEHFTISLAGLILLTAFTFIAIVSLALSILFGVALMIYDTELRTRQRNKPSRKLFYTQRLALVCGGLYFAAASVQFFRDVVNAG